jgi:hypothetical protein
MYSEDELKWLKGSEILKVIQKNKNRYVDDYN